MSELIRAWLLHPLNATLMAMKVSIANLLKEIKMNHIELIGRLNEVFDTLGVVSEESKAMIAAIKTLEAAVAAAGQTTPAVDAALAAVLARAQAIDALVPNAPPAV